MGTDHGHEEKREISLRESQMLLRNRRDKRVIGCRQRAESTLRVRPGINILIYETDVLVTTPSRKDDGFSEHAS
jgi:hypothetical protein